MADDDQIGQDEIEALLQQAQGGDAAASAPKPEAPINPTGVTGDGSFSLSENEIESLMSADIPAATAAPAPSGDPGAAPPVAQAGAVSQNDIEFLLTHAQEAIASIDGETGEPPPGVKPFRLESFGGAPANNDSATLELVRDVQLDLKIELGRTLMPLEDVLRLRRDAVVALDKLAGDPVDVYANGRLIARGEVLVLNDNFCVRVTELIVGDSAVA